MNKSKETLQDINKINLDIGPVIILVWSFSSMGFFKNLKLIRNENKEKNIKKKNWKEK